MLRHELRYLRHFKFQSGATALTVNVTLSILRIYFKFQSGATAFLHGMTYDELRTKAQEAFPNCTYVEGPETEQQLFYKNYTHENGQMTAPPEPTAEEQKAKKQAELQSTYESNKEELMKYYLAASLAGDADTQNELRTELTNLDAQFDSDMKALNG